MLRGLSLMCAFTFDILSIFLYFYTSIFIVWYCYFVKKNMNMSSTTDDMTCHSRGYVLQLWMINKKKKHFCFTKWCLFSFVLRNLCVFSCNTGGVLPLQDKMKKGTLWLNCSQLLDIHNPWWRVKSSYCLAGGPKLNMSETGVLEKKRAS